MRINSEITGLLAEGCDRLGIELDNRALTRLACYFGELQKWNKKINLIARAPEQEIVDRHFLDSLTLLPFLRQHSSKPLLDVGSGGGFPALVLKACLPELQLTLVEPRLKRVSFLKHIIRILELGQVTVMDSRLAPENRLFQGQTFPLISCRGLTKVSNFLEMCRSFSPEGGRVICMKGPKADEELADWQDEQPASPYRLAERINCLLPFSRSKRIILIFSRQSQAEPFSPSF
jgi:16S rRNA (guanine527-N7)-methyltransferase